MIRLVFKKYIVFIYHKVTVQCGKRGDERGINAVEIVCVRAITYLIEKVLR